MITSKNLIRIEITKQADPKSNFTLAAPDSANYCYLRVWYFPALDDLSLSIINFVIVPKH